MDAPIVVGDVSETFKKALSLILIEEGTHNVDEGGDTVFGIARMFHPDEPWPPTLDRAKEIYYHDYWLPLQCDLLPPDVAIYLFDMAVNQGMAYAVTTLQSHLGVRIDGHIGPDTIRAIHDRDARTLTGNLHAHRSQYYVNRGGPEMVGLLVRLRTLAVGTYGKEGVA